MARLTNTEKELFSAFTHEVKYGDLLKYSFKHFGRGSNCKQKDVINKVDPSLLSFCEDWFNLFLVIEDKVHIIEFNMEKKEI